MLASITQIVTIYGMEEMLEGFTPDLINILLRNHIDKVKQAQDYNATLALSTAALSAHLGTSIDVADCIKNESDRKKLYQLMADWRVLLLAEVFLSHPSS